MSVAAWSGALLKWEQELSELKDRLASAFGWVESAAAQAAAPFGDRLLRANADAPGLDDLDLPAKAFGRKLAP
jgi:hypothetical protein